NLPGAKALTWKLPLVVADASGARRAPLVDRGGQGARFPGCGAVIVNTGDTGYYRVQYDGRDADPKRFPPLDRLRLLSDTFALVQAGRADVSRYLSLVEALGDETDRSIWDQVIGSLRFMGDLIDKPDEREAFDRYTAAVLEKPFGRVGWDARPDEPPDAALLRRSLIYALGRAGQKDVVREAKARFAAGARL